jgi:hypothetical protein
MSLCNVVGLAYSLAEKPARETAWMKLVNRLTYEINYYIKTKVDFLAYESCTT